MQIPIISHLRKAAIKRDFLRNNADVRHVFGTRRSSKARPVPTAAPLPSADVQHWDDFGFLILRGFFQTSAIDDFKRHIDTIWQSRHTAENPSVIFTPRGGHYFRDALDEDRSSSYRLVDQYLTDPATRDMCMHPRLVEILHQLMGHTPVVCNTILFEYGSEQEMHSDMFYMPPKTENQMLATWIALDDVTDDNGPLVYVPGSHKLPPHRFSNGKVNAVTEEVAGASLSIQKRMEELGLRREKFLAKRGDVLIWHSNLMHGGEAIRDRSATRTSIVTHYLSTCDVPNSEWQCAERNDGSMLLVKKHLSVAKNGGSSLDEHD